MNRLFQYQSPKSVERKLPKTLYSDEDYEVSRRARNQAKVQEYLVSSGLVTDRS